MKPELVKNNEDPPKKKRVINVSKEVWDYIAKHSLPLVDSPDSTLRRLFNLPPKK